MWVFPWPSFWRQASPLVALEDTESGVCPAVQRDARGDPGSLPPRRGRRDPTKSRNCRVGKAASLPLVVIFA